jgi:arsenate reductase
MSKTFKVLFVCVHNSGRSQMAEAYLRHFAGDRFEVQSAGFEPRPINPLVVEAMQEDGLDLSQVQSDSVFEFYKDGRLFDYVITVCDGAASENCPLFPGVTKRVDLPFDDPAELEGTHEERLEGVRRIRDQIKAQVQNWVEELA